MFEQEWGGGPETFAAVQQPAAVEASSKGTEILDIDWGKVGVWAGRRVYQGCWLLQLYKLSQTQQ